MTLLLFTFNFFSLTLSVKYTQLPRWYLYTSYVFHLKPFNASIFICFFIVMPKKNITASIIFLNWSQTYNLKIFSYFERRMFQHLNKDTNIITFFWFIFQKSFFKTLLLVFFFFRVSMDLPERVPWQDMTNQALLSFCCLQIRKSPSAKYHYPWPVRQRVLLNQTPVSHQLPVFCIGRGKKFTTEPSSSSILI